MTDLVDPARIETIVGVERHATDHYARVASWNQKVYILHSQACLDSGIDLRDCPFSVALDRGITHYIPAFAWTLVQDKPVRAELFEGWLIPHLDDLWKKARR